MKMTKYFLIVAFVLPFVSIANESILAGKFIYNYKDGVPQFRTNIQNGKVEIYTNLKTDHVSRDKLKNIHEKFYSDITYSDFEKKICNKYNIEVSDSVEAEYKWRDFSRYKIVNKINEL